MGFILYVNSDPLGMAATGNVVKVLRLSRLAEKSIIESHCHGEWPGEVMSPDLLELCFNNCPLKNQ